eukprot:gene8227-5749_t
MSEARHIQSMIDFIEREAQEKVEELEAAAQEEYDVEKMRVVETEKAKIRALTDKKKTQVDIDCRVSKANFSKTQRMRIMAERAKVMEELEEVTKKGILATIANPSEYETLLRDLIRQSILAIRTSVVVTCIKEDESVVNSLMKGLVDWYRSQRNEAITITVSKNYLDKEEVWGGVVVASADGRIVCNNTLAHRAKTCFEEQLPAVRYYLFNADVSL